MLEAEGRSRATRLWLDEMSSELLGISLLRRTNSQKQREEQRSLEREPGKSSHNGESTLGFLRKGAFATRLALGLGVLRNSCLGLRLLQ